MAQPATALRATTAQARHRPGLRPFTSAATLRLARAGAHRSAWRALRHPAFRTYLAGSVASNLGTWLQNTAQMLLAYQLTRSVLAVGVVTCAQFSGSLLLGPWAAVVASRIGGRRMLIATQVLSAAIAAAMAGLEAAGLLGELSLVVGALALGLAFTFALPVQTALVPRLVPDADTEAAMTMNSVSYNAGRALAPALCVLLVDTSGFTVAFACNAASFLVYAAALVKARPESDARPARPPRASDGVRAALRQRRILLLLAMVAAVTFADDPVLVLGPMLVRQLTDAGPSWAGYFLSALGLGTVLGSLRTSEDPQAKGGSSSSKRAAISLLCLVACIGTFAAGFGRWVSLAAAFLAGAAALRTGAVTQTELVRQLPNGTASVMALWAIAWAGTKPIASLADGWLGSHQGVIAAAVVLGLPATVLGLAEILLPPPCKARIKTLVRDWAERGLRVRAAASRPGPALPAPMAGTPVATVAFVARVNSFFNGVHRAVSGSAGPAGPPFSEDPLLSTTQRLGCASLPEPLREGST